MEQPAQRGEISEGRAVAAESQQATAEPILGSESPEIVATATAVGEQRLQRLGIAHAITALIGGMAVSFGAVAMAWTAGPWLATLGQERAILLGALLFPIGFVILLVGKGELFTENFFVPVTGVIEGRGKIHELLELWGYTLAFNLIGAAIFAVLITRPGVFGESAGTFMVNYALDKLDEPFWTALVKGIFAGWLITILTWLIVAAESLGPRLVIIWAIGFLIIAGHFNHVVISAAEIFMAIGLNAPITLETWLLDNFTPALLGNLVGGIVFVTLLGVLQARILERSEAERRGEPSPGDDQV